MEQILILDFGSQYTQLIARRLRNSKVYCEILPYSAAIEEIKGKQPKGLILSGGPSNIYSVNAPRISRGVFETGIPVLGICYGMQLISHIKGGLVSKARKREYGLSEVKIVEKTPLFEGLPSKITAWMSHGDEVKKNPPGFKVTGKTNEISIAAMENPQKNIYAVQFHPEVHHTQFGEKIIENFARKICGVEKEWNPYDFVKESIRKIRNEIGRLSAVCALSGGVDSSVAAVIVNKAIGRRLNCIFVDTGLLRIGDRERIENIFRKRFRFNIKIANASGLFLSRLKGIEDPEKKRKIIGKTFIEVFEKEAKKIKNAGFLVQGTLYPDIIESVSVKGPSAVIKSHHNVGGLPEKMGLKIVEPLKFLFKDEVRRIGARLFIPREILSQHPFPGPGLAIRIIGSVTRRRLEILRRADKIMRQEITKAGWYDKIWQAFCVLLPIKSVGVMGDERSYENVLAIRAVESVDGMTADWSKIPHKLLGKISSRIISEVKGINRIVYDTTSKPPATIEWE